MAAEIIEKRDRFAYVVAFNLNWTAIPMPCHDPPVAWRVGDNALARMGFPVIACPAFAAGVKGQIAAGAAEYMDPEPIILPAEPGRR